MTEELLAKYTSVIFASGIYVGEGRGQCKHASELRDEEYELKKELLASTKGLTAQKDTAYAERDLLVCVLSKVWPAHLCRHPDEDVEWEDDWRWIICIHSPKGQLTWHIHDSELPMFSGHLAVLPNHWDGHTTDEKYERLLRVPLQYQSVTL